MPYANTLPLSRGAMIAALILFLAGVCTGAVIAVWQAEPAASEQIKDGGQKPERRRIFPRRVDVA